MMDKIIWGYYYIHLQPTNMDLVMLYLFSRIPDWDDML
jgi:hypothetical protein